MNIEKIRRLHRAKQQRIRLLRGERIFQPVAQGCNTTETCVVRIIEYKARKVRQAIWKNESK